MRATQKQLHGHQQDKKHKKDLHKKLSKTLKGPRIHLQRTFCPKDRPEEVRKAQRCLEPAPLRTTSPSCAGQPRHGEDEAGGIRPGLRKIQWKSQTK